MPLTPPYRVTKLSIYVTVRNFNFGIEDCFALDCTLKCCRISQEKKRTILLLRSSGNLEHGSEQDQDNTVTNSVCFKIPNKNKLTTLTVVDNNYHCQAHSLADTLKIPLMYNPVLWNNFHKKNFVKVHWIGKSFGSHHQLILA